LFAASPPLRSPTIVPPATAMPWSNSGGIRWTRPHTRAHIHHVSREHLLMSLHWSVPQPRALSDDIRCRPSQEPKQERTSFHHV
jgi:hypothetical protein